MKHIRAIIAAALALSLCGCAQTASEPEQNEETLTVSDMRDTESFDSTETDEAFMPFVKTVAAEYAYIEIVPGGLSGVREDGTVVEPARLSDEDAESVFELLQQIRIEKPPLNEHAWETPEGGYWEIFRVSRYISSVVDVVDTLTVIPSGRVVMISRINFLADEEVVSELCDLYDELYCKYYPDLAEKWNLS